MPPRVKLPHGLTKDPRLMSLGEKGVFGLLAASIGIGVYKLATSPWGEQQEQSPSKTSSLSDMGAFGQEQQQIQQQKPQTVLELTEDLKPKRTTLAVEDGITEVDATLQPPKVNDGVTDIKFGEPGKR